MEITTTKRRTKENEKKSNQQENNGMLQQEFSVQNFDISVMENVSLDFHLIIPDDSCESKWIKFSNFSKFSIKKINQGFSLVR